MNEKTRVTDLLAAVRNGDPDALDCVFPLVYEELRRIAWRQLAGRESGHTLNTTALVHEAYLELVDREAATYHDRAHFLAICARAMRQILVDHARRRGAAKRGGARAVFSLDGSEIAVEERAEVLVALDEALSKLGEFNERQGRVVECRFFGGLTEEETAVALGVSDRTVRRDWTKARLWLYGELEGEGA